MMSPVQGRVGHRARGLTLALVMSSAWIVAPGRVVAGPCDGHAHPGAACSPTVCGNSAGPGFLGFGLSYHLGYGYGGRGIGVGPSGGYPLYGGPGYPHCEPELRRLKRLEPFYDYGGPPYPRAGHSNYYQNPGPLIVKPTVATQGSPGQFGYSGNYGIFTGTLPYPDSYFAPYTSEAADTGSSDVPSPPRRPSRPLFEPGTDGDTLPPSASTTRGQREIQTAGAAHAPGRSAASSEVSSPH